MNKILLVIDGLGVGNMNDSPKSNTWLSVYQKNRWPILEKIIEKGQKNKLELDYIGADSYLGHLTMSGIKVSNLKLKPLCFYKDEIIKELNLNYFHAIDKGYIEVNKSVIISDNFEAEHGLAINVNGLRDLISIKLQDQIAKIVRKIVRNPRVITFGASKISMINFTKEIMRDEEWIGLNTPKTGIYNDTFDVTHLPLIENFKDSVQNKFYLNNYSVFMYGKFENIIKVNFATSFKESDTKKVFDLFFKHYSDKEDQLHCINIQETDLAGHEQNKNKFQKALDNIEINLKRLLDLNNAEIIITADHGNDPTIGSSGHTREYVPFFSNKKITKKITKLSDISKFLLLDIKR